MRKIFKTGLVCGAAAIVGSVAYLIYCKNKENKDFADEKNTTVLKDAHSYVTARREAMMRKTEEKKVDIVDEPLKVVDTPKVGQTTPAPQNTEEKVEEKIDEKEAVAEKINEVKEILKEAKSAMEAEGVSEPKA